jgi:arylsulfatase A-like enzyme
VDVPPYVARTPEALEDLRGYNSAISYADEATGRILTRLRETGLEENTIVVFTTDHGIPFPRAKSTLFDAGIEVALIVKLPGNTTRVRERSSCLVSHVDVVPTLLELVGAPVPANVQGVSFTSQLVGGLESAHREEIFAEKNWHGLRQYDPVRCVRTEQYKYVVSYEDRPVLPLPLDIALAGSSIGVDDTATRPRVELYDLAADPQEQVNLAGDESVAEVEKDLAERLQTWQEETFDPILQGPVPAARLKRTKPGPRAKGTVLIDPQFVQRS